MYIYIYIHSYEGGRSTLEMLVGEGCAEQMMSSGSFGHPTKILVCWSC